MKVPLIALSLLASGVPALAQAPAKVAPPTSKFPSTKSPGTPVPSVAPSGTIALTAGADDCSSARFITGSGPHPFNTTGATTGAQGQGNGNCLFFGTTGIDNDTWYIWQSNFSGTAQLTLCGGASHDSKVAVYDGGGCPVNAAISCNDDSCNLQSQLSFAAIAGNFYTIQLGNYPGTAGGSGTFLINGFAPPPNDDCSAAIAVFGSGPHAFDNTNATTGSQGQNNPNCQFQFGGLGIADDVWYTWQAGFSGVAQLTLCAGASNDSKIAAYNGAGCPGAQALGCDDDSCLFAGPSRVTFNVVAGNVYTFQIGCYGTGLGQAGTFTVDPFVPGAGDDCSAPTVISGPGPHAFDTTSMTTGAEGQNNPNCQFAFGGLGIFDDQWFLWQSNCTGSVTVSMCAGASHDAKLAVYDGSACPSSTALACDDDLCVFAGPGEIVFNAINGNSYMIQIGNFGAGAGGTGTFDISGCTGSGPGTAFCAGDGSLPTACPCNNFGVPSAGCDNSAGTGGAVLSGAGTTNPDTVVLTSIGELPSVLSIFLQGTAQISNGVFFGDGVRCVGGVLKRLYIKSASGGVVSAPTGSDPPITSQSAILGDPLSPGTTRWYQVYYRDPFLGFCPSPPGNSWNVSSGYQITW